MLSVQNNLAAMNAGRMFKISGKKNEKSSEKLSSGYRINRAADDAAGLSISEKMRWQIRGMNRASNNAQDGISLIQTAEGALGEIHSMLHRANELAIQAANGTLTEADRAAVDKEVQQLKKEIDDTSRKALYNGMPVFPDDGYLSGSPNTIATHQYQLNIDVQNGVPAVNLQKAGQPGISRALNPVSAGGAMADGIAAMVSSSLAGILGAFPAFAGQVNAASMDIRVEVGSIDGRNDTLAYAGFTFSYAGGPPKSLRIRVDTADFTLEDVTNPQSERYELLKSTINHEMLHTVMQYTLTDGMSGRFGEKYPTWFVEGTAQLTGGGFSTGWNTQLAMYAQQLNSENDASQDGNIRNFIKEYTINSRPYGHGYLAAAYAGYLAGGGGAVTSGNIAAGMNLIFSDLIGGKSLEQTLKDRTGYNSSEINSLFRSGNAGVVEFSRKLAYNSIRADGTVGAGSVIGGLSSGKASMVMGGGSTLWSMEDMWIKDLKLQVGALGKQGVDVGLYQMNTKVLGLRETNVLTEESSGNAITAVQDALGRVSEVRSLYGALQNRLEHTIANLDNTAENTTAAESAIRDTDMAEEIVEHSTHQILLQAGISMMTQANHQPDQILTLLQ